MTPWRTAGTVLAALAFLTVACARNDASPDTVDAPDVAADAPCADCAEPETTRVCDPECTLRECGYDGCGKLCGVCPSDQECLSEGVCGFAEYPDCRGKVCGDDGWGGTCGTCAEGSTCQPDGTCEVDCVPDCVGKDCGPDGCGGSCGGWCMYGTCIDGHSTGCDGPPDCTGKVCGPDGWGGTCGTCEGETTCAADQKSCKGLTFGKATRVNALYVAATPDETGAGPAPIVYENLAGATCLDVTGDGTLDNGLGTLLGTLAGFGVDANGELQKALADGSLDLLLDLGDDPEIEPFTLNGYLGQPGAVAGDYGVDPASFVDGQAMIHFEGAELTAGKLELGPITFPLGALLAGVLADAGIPPIDLTLDRVQLVGTVDGAIDDTGVAFKDGTLAGVVFKADLAWALYLARTWCVEDPQAPADTCGYIVNADMGLVETFLSWDQEVENCGKKLPVYDAHDRMIVVGEEDNCQAVSACIFWGSEKARITGIAPASVE